MELWEIMEANMTESAERQKRNYPGQNLAAPMVGQRVLLDDSARGKLDPHWTGPWKVISVKGPLTLELQMGSAKRIVHINRVRPLLIGDVDYPRPNKTECFSFKGGRDMRVSMLIKEDWPIVLR